MMNKAKNVIRRLYTSNVVQLPTEERGKYMAIRLCKGGKYTGNYMELNAALYNIAIARSEFRKSCRGRRCYYARSRHKNRKLWRLHGTKRPWTAINKPFRLMTDIDHIPISRIVRDVMEFNVHFDENGNERYGQPTCK